MRIAILGSVALPIPPPLQGGTEWIAYHQARGLAQKGHDVFLFAASGSNISHPKVRIIEVGKGDVVSGSSKETEYDPKTMEASRALRKEISYLSLAAKKLIELQKEYDVILNNMRGEGIFLPVAKLLGKPFVNVMHLNLFPELADLFRLYNTQIITISNSQRKAFPGLSYLATVYNGVETEKFPLNEDPEDYLLMMGSIGRHKNQEEAIAVAKELGMKLILAGKVRDKDYFEELNKDIDGEQIRWIGELSFEEKVKLYQGARAFLFPIAWEEPFGLVMIEAMSCGTPVVAFNRGAVSEVVRNGLTGYVVENHSQMVDAVKKINSIGRRACRRHVEENFTVEKMVDKLEKALESPIPPSLQAPQESL